MNPMATPGITGASGTAGGGLLPDIPLWYPPMSSKWILTGLVVFAAAVTNRIKPDIRRKFTSPLGFFLMALLSFVTFKYGFPPLAFALMFFLLNTWAVDTSEGYVDAVNNRRECNKTAYESQEMYPQFFEGFLGASEVELVTNNKRWFVERVLKENPEAIVDKGVLTQAISGFSAQGSTTNGNT